MKRCLALGVVLGLVGCDNVDSGLAFVKYVRPNESCLVSPEDPSAIFYQFDPFFQGDLDVFAVLRNDLVVPEQLFNEELELGATPPTTVTISDFEYVFQCDASIFSGAPQLFLPIFGASEVPFCQDPRDEDASFQGFDVRPVDSSAIEPASTNPVGVKLITGELGRAFQEMFVLAVAADVCCNNAGPDDLCGQQRIDELPSTPECDELRNAVLQGRLPASQVQTIRQFAKFDRLNPAGWVGSTYTLDVVGNYVGQTVGGRTVTSNQARLQIGLIGREFEELFNDPNTTQDERDAARNAVRCQSRVLF